MEWVLSTLIDLIGTYRWFVVAAGVGIVAILFGLAAPISLWLEAVLAAMRDRRRTSLARFW